MKIALICDTHWGVRNDSVHFMDSTKRFLDDVFFPRLNADGIDHVIHLGDIVDRRKYINFNTAKRLREDFLKPLQDAGITMDVIAGNHDVYYKNTNEVNALQELIDGKFQNICVFTEAFTTWQKDDTQILYVPWINEENRDRSLEKIKQSNASIVLGHLELSGFQMYRGSTESHGDSPDMFGRFDLVCSGHYHHKSSSGNIHYLGSHSQFTWSDYGDDRGFHILDTETKQLEFVANPYAMFAKVWYDDSKDIAVDFESLKNKFVKVIVSNKDDLYNFDRFIDKIEKAGVINLQVVEDHLNLNLEGDEDIVNEAESTVDIFKKYIDQIDVNINKKKLESTIVNLYNEALTVQ